MHIFSFLEPKPTISDHDIAAGLRWFTWEGTVSLGLFSITTSGFLVAYALALGANNFQIGILAAIPFIMQTMQLPAIWIVEKYRRRKAIALITWLSAQLRIPRSWIGDFSAFHAQWAAAVDLVRRDYHLPVLSPNDRQRAFERLISGDAIDFAQLDSQRQAAVIRQVRSEPSRRRELLELNTQLPAALTVNRSLVADQLDSQAARVEQEYSLERAGQRLGKIYRTLAESARSEVHALEHGQKILMHYLDPTCLHLIRLEQ